MQLDLAGSELLLLLSSSAMFFSEYRGAALQAETGALRKVGSQPQRAEGRELRIDQVGPWITRARL